MRNKHFGQGFSHAGALGRVVVNENDRLKTKVELGHQLNNILDLVAPIDAPSRKITRSQDHFGMVLKGGERDGLLILAYHGEQNTSIQEALQHSLEIEVGLAHRIVAPELNVLPSQLPLMV